MKYEKEEKALLDMISCSNDCKLCKAEDLYCGDNMVNNLEKFALKLIKEVRQLEKEN